MNLFSSGMWHNATTGRFDELQTWQVLRDLPTYGHNPALRNPRRTVNDYVNALVERGYLLEMNQEIPFYCLRDTSGALIGLEFRFGRQHYVPS